VTAQVGDDFAWWESGDGDDSWIIAFPKTARARRAIPAHAHWGKIEPGLPDKVPPPGWKGTEARNGPAIKGRQAAESIGQELEGRAGFRAG
jgi:hypothetical protein